MALGTYSDLKTAVTTWAMRTGDDEFEASVPDFIALGEARLNRRLRLGAMEASNTITLTDGEGALPADYLELRRFTRDTSPDKVLEPLSLAGATDLAFTSGGQALYYSIQGSSVSVYPSMTGDIPIDYYAKIPALSDASPTNWLLTSHPDLYLYAALIEAAPFMMEDARLPTWTALLEKALQDVEAQDRRSRYSTARTRVRGVIL